MFSHHIRYGTTFEISSVRLSPISLRYPRFIDEKAVGELVCRLVNTVTCELKLAPPDRLSERRLASKMIKALVYYVISGLFNT